MSSECSEDDLPLVTIITPTYNSNPQYLKEAIESVLAQTYPKIEYIITDDGSSVFHEELIHELLDVGNRGNITWKIIRHDENVGTVKNMNGAIRESHGEYIFPLAHDDVYYDERVIEEWVKEFQRTNALVITASMVLENGKPFHSEKSVEILSNPSCFNLRKTLSIDNIIPAPATAQARRCFTDYGLYDENYTIIEDYPRWIKLLENNVQITYWSHTVVRYRKSGVSSSKHNIRLENDLMLIRRQNLSLANGGDKIPLAVLYSLQWMKQKILKYSERSESSLIKKIMTVPLWISNNIFYVISYICQRKLCIRKFSNILRLQNITMK